MFSGAETTVKVGSCSASLLAAVAVAATLGLPGCDSNSYSAAIRYLVRSDPLVITDKLGPADNPGGERNNPDRPGQLPLFTANDLLEFPNPYFKDAAERDDVKLFDQNKMMDPSKLSGENRKILQDALDDLFGTPAEPKLEGIDSATRDKILLPPEEAKQGITAMQMLEKGSKYYRIHCLHCHGVTGNGRGPTSRWVNPHPRDYRRGFFKFQSTDQTEKEQKPSRADLLRTLEEGIEGTQMPSFNLLSNHDLQTLISYVIHLSIRGEAEFLTIKQCFQFNPAADALDLKAGQDPPKYLKAITKVVGKTWLNSQTEEMRINPVPYPKYTEEQMKESVESGQALFTANEEQLKILGIKVAASCVSCHKDFGRQATYRYDYWGTLVRPADLTKGVYRGGRRPVDIYYRIHSGINGSGMAPFGGTLSGEQIWDLVNFVRAIPYKGMRQQYGIKLN